MLTQSCTQCHKEHLGEESLYDAQGQAFCSAYCLKLASGKPVAPQLPPKKTLPLAPFVVVFALLFWGFWRLLAPGEVVSGDEAEETLQLSQQEVSLSEPLVEPSVMATPLSSPTGNVSVNNTSSSASPNSESLSEASLPPSGGGANAAPAANTPSVKAFALARQAALLLPMDAPRAIVLAQESITLYPNREAYRVLISYADRKDRAIQKDTYLKACLALTSDTKGVDYCYIDKVPEAEASASDPDLFAPLPEPSLDAARQVAPPSLNSEL
jgi:hypothetical protein